VEKILTKSMWHIGLRESIRECLREGKKKIISVKGKEAKRERRKKTKERKARATTEPSSLFY
jgi:hypothetical protein